MTLHTIPSFVSLPHNALVSTQKKRGEARALRGRQTSCAWQVPKLNPKKVEINPQNNHKNKNKAFFCLTGYTIKIEWEL